VLNARPGRPDIAGAPPGPGLATRDLAGRIRWGVIDQALSSLTNFALVLLVARASEPAAFGGFSVVFVGYLLALWACRSLVGDPFALRFSASRACERQASAAAAAGAGLGLGLAGAVGMGLAAAATGNPGAGAGLALAVALPALLLQETLRGALVAGGRPAAAAANDAVWLAAQVVATAVVLWRGRASPAALCLAFGIGAALAAAVGCVQLRVVPALTRAWSEVRRQADVGVPLLVELVVVNGAPQAALFGAGAVAGSVVVGQVRAALLLFGPLTVVYAGLVFAGLPEAARLRRRSVAAFEWFVRRLGLGMAVAGTAAGAALSLVPDRLGVALLGDNWPATPPLVPLVGVFVAAGGCTFAALVGLRAAGAVRESLRARSWVVPVIWAATLVGAASAGAAGAAAGLAAGSCVDAAVAWATLRRVLRRGAVALPAMPTAGLAGQPDPAGPG